MAALVAALFAQVALTAKPDVLQLGRDDRSTIEVRGEAGSRVRFEVSAGSIDTPIERAPGVFTAEFRPPDDTVPQVSIIAARLEKDGAIRSGWLALPLWGAADAVIRGKPLSWMTMRIGPNQFGPVRADETGRAVVHVVIPPGVDDARSGERLVPLHVPVKPTLLVVLQRDRTPGGREQDVAVTIYATSRTGAPLSAGKILLNPTTGRVSEAAPVEPGVFTALWTLPADAQGPLELSASIPAPDPMSSVARILVDTAPSIQPVVPPSPPRPEALAASERPSRLPFDVALSPKLGLVSNGRDFTSPAIALEGAVRTRRFGPQLEALGELSWAFSSVASLATLPAGNAVAVRSRADYLTAAAAVGAFFPIGERTLAFAHVGPTLACVWSTLKIAGNPSASAATLVPGAQISVGIERKLWWSTPFVELRWSFSSDPSLDRVLNGSLNWFGIHGGARLDVL